MGAGGMFVDAGETFNLAPPDRRLFVEFDLKPCLDEAASEKAGRPIFTDKEYVRIIIPGDRLATIHKEVSDAIRLQYREQYQAWKTGGDQHASTGTPLSVWAWPGCTKSVVEELKFFKCYTVEQLAGLRDDVLSRMGPGYLKLREGAKEWLAAAKSGAPLAKMQGEAEELRSRIAALEDLVKKQDAALQKTGKRGQQQPEAV